MELHSQLPGDRQKKYFPLHYFFSENENTTTIQVRCTQVVELLLTVTQKIAQAKKTLPVVASTIRIQMVNMHSMSEAAVIV